MYCAAAVAVHAAVSRREFLVQILKNGDMGAEVALLQKGLVRAGFGPLRLDGIFGRATERSLRAFQKAGGLRVDGISGPRTEAAMTPWYTGYTVHTIAPGDTLWRIAGRYHSTLLALEIANPDLDPFDLRPGQRLTVPFDFPVVPTDIPWCSELTEYCVQGLGARYPGFTRQVIGHSVRPMPIYALTVGEGRRRVLFTGGHHANEWITVPLLMKYTEALLAARAAGETVGGYDAEEILSSARITLVPCVDPDGVDLVTDALPARTRAKAEAIAALWPAIPFPSGWKANLEGVDLNLQYPAMWEQAREIKFAQGYDRPAPRDYVGSAPLSAPESRALADFTRELDPELILAGHTPSCGLPWDSFINIYWGGPNGFSETRRTQLPCCTVNSMNIAVEDVPYASGFAGYKDWFITAFDRPGYTVEAGLGENPLPLGQFDSIWRSNAPLLTAAAIG